jgi:uncharacterized protein (DUF58 family)
MPNTAAPSSRFLDVRALSALANMRFVTRQRIEGPYSGRHLSRQLGGAGEFVDYREYSEGEDLRRLDWKVLGRTGRAYIRLFQDETNLVCTLVIDASASMLFNGQRKGQTGGSKLEYAQYLAASLAYLIHRQQDQVGLAVVSQGIRNFLAPSATGLHMTRVQEAIEKIQCDPTTQLAASLRDLFTRGSRRGVLVLLSDFLVDDPREVFSAVRLFRHRGWEVIAMHLIHPDEERLPEGLAYHFEGMENDGSADCSPREIRAAYQKMFTAHVAAVRGMALGAGCDYRRISTASPYLQTLGTFLVNRAG